MAKEESVEKTREAIDKWDTDDVYIAELNRFIGSMGEIGSKMSIANVRGYMMGVPAAVVERLRNCAIDLARSEIHLATERMKALEIPAA